MTMESHLKNRKKLRMAKIKMRRVGRAIAELNGIIIA